MSLRNIKMAPYETHCTLEGVRLEEKLRNKVEIALPVLTVFSFLQSGLRFLIDL